MSAGESNEIPCNPLPLTARTDHLKTSFAAHYKCDPEFYVRVPGRVNLIGEHVDYCGYGVCPMALQQDILLAVSTDNTADLEIMNLDPNYAAHKQPIADIEINVREGGPEWHQYFLCGVRGILDVLPDGNGLKGLKVLVSGTIPQSAGLSSSSALVSAAALATSYAHELSLSKEKIASVCAECERYIGTQGGGMDQAIAFLATKGCAKLINFNPLRSEDVLLPPKAVFVIAHSLTRLNKAATADYNCRVVECRLAAQILAKKNDIDWQSIRKLGDLQKALNCDLPKMIALVSKTLHEAPYTKQEVLQELETTNEALHQASLTDNTIHIESFKLHQRALHVFQEALRVQKFHEICRDSSGEGSLEALGRLMSESHDSLRDLYECSHPQLDRLVELSAEVALGARLTGAGWGGCAVALVTPENVEGYIECVKDRFYRPLGVTENFEKFIFATEPQSGACIFIESPTVIGDDDLITF